MKLYEINAEIESCIDMETGEVVDAEKLDALQIEKKEKVKNIALWIKNLKSDEAALKAEKDAFDARMKAAKRKRESLESYLSNCLQGEAVKDTEFAISFRTSKAVSVLDEKAIPEEWWKQAAPTLMKAELLAALKEGKEIPGAVLEERQNMSVK